MNAFIVGLYTTPINHFVHEKKADKIQINNGICKIESLSSATDSLSILHQGLVGQRYILWALIAALADEPPDSNKDGQTASHQTGIVH